MAAEVRIDVSEVERLAVHLGAVPDRTVARVSQAVQDTGRDIEQDARRIVRKRSRKTEQSITARQVDELMVEVGPTTFYARYLEDGTSKMPAYPFMGPATDLNEFSFVERVQRAVEVDW